MNDQAFQAVAEHLEAPYQLNTEGCSKVVESNRQLSESYFEHLTFPVSPFWESYFVSKLSVIEPAQREVCVDVCCGTGTLCLNIMPSIGFETLVAVDNSATAIETLKQRIQAQQAIEARQDDITCTSFMETSIDAVYGNSFLHHLPDNPSFLQEMHRILRPGGVIVFTGEPTIGAAFLENAIMMPILKMLWFFRLKKRRTNENPVTDIWLYEKSTLSEMLSSVGFTEIQIKPFGFLVTLFNWPSAILFKIFTGKSAQPDWYWKILGYVDRLFFFWLPPNCHSHFVIAARKKEA